MYEVDGYIPAAKIFEVRFGRQASRLLGVATRPPTFRMVSRMELPEGQGGALASATSGLAVGETTKLPPVLKGFSVKTAEAVAVSPDSKSLAITWTR